MQVTSDIQIRRARVKQMIAEGRVMNDAMRKRQRDEVKRLQKLQDAADLILAESCRVSQTPMGSNYIVEKTSAPEANVILNRNSKVDRLALAADSILKELQGV